MNWTIVVGVIISLMFLVSFTEWFYHLASGMDALIVSDSFEGYNIMKLGISSMLFMVFVFWIVATFYECPTPEEEREGLFAYMDCTIYSKVKSSPLGVYIPSPKIEDEIKEDDGQIEEEAPTYTGEEVLPGTF